MTGVSVPYEAGLKQDLQDPEEAAAYLDAAIEDSSQQVFLLALRDVAEAAGVARVARRAGLNRENTYRILSEKGNPQMSSLMKLLDALGLRLAVEVKRRAAV